MNIKSYIYTLPNKGNMAWEYNPFHNYLTDVNLYQWNGFIIPEGLAVNKKNGELLTQKGRNWIDRRGNIINDDDCKSWDEHDVEPYVKAGSLLDLDTDKLKFDLEHPVDILIQPSYDGSVNLILNDDKNIPRLINSRFSTREKNTYEIVDRIGENDTNIYNSSSFDKDSSLYFQYESNPIINYLGFSKGVLPVGLYCFYLTYCDADDNESDYISESGLVPVFIGTDGNPESLDGGIKNQISNKGIRLLIKNLDKSYNYLRVYYVRYFADLNLHRVYECKKILKRYSIDSNLMYIQISGEENTETLDPNILNLTRFNPKCVLTSALCKNMLFLGNIVKNSDNYKELTDLSMRIIPKVFKDTLETPNVNYEGESGYYSSTNIYSKTGYFNREYYRFGIVYIYKNGTLSNVYNTLGAQLSPNLSYIENTIYEDDSSDDDSKVILVRKYINVDDDGWIQNGANFFKHGEYLNSKGVCKIECDSVSNNEILGIQFNIPLEVKKYLLEELDIRGFFFVRQKCVPNILAQCYLLPMDEVLEAPVLEVLEDGKFNHYAECFLSLKTGETWSKDKKRWVPQGERYVINDYDSRLYKFEHKDAKSSISDYAYAAVCPDFLLNLPYYNQFFNGSKFKLLKLTQALDGTGIKGSALKKNGRFYQVQDDVTIQEDTLLKEVTINSVTEEVPTVAIKDKIYRLEIGKAEESFRFRYVEVDNGTYDAGTRVKNMYKKGYSVTDLVDEAANLVRGIYSPYLAIYSTLKLDTSCLYNIFLDTYSPSNLRLEFYIRMDSTEPFYAISDRYNFSVLNSENALTCWRGDCYINNFTYRLNRNFSDPSLPNNDVIIEPSTWRFFYKSADPSQWGSISRSDLNAVQMGSWIDFKVRSSMNYALRSENHSYTSEKALMGSPRSFYPKSHLMYKGENKLPDSYLYNDAYRASLGFKCYFALNNVNYLKDTFSNRIQYSAIAIQDSYKNNYRYSLSTYFRDYSSEYGSITKLVGFEGYLLVVFEHAVAVAVINERILLSQGDGEPVFINTKNVLPEELTIISDTIGSQWTESVVKSESGYVYGVDTVAKKIWRVRGLQLDIISDFRVNKFLIENITLSERELYPTIGLKNVKTHYNNNKKDVMFTFYDDVYKDEEKVWNLCYNELMELFMTFYSWVPSYSENIDTQFFTFNRNTSKLMSLLAKSNYNIPENNGILLDTPIINIIKEDNYIGILEYPNIHYVHKSFGLIDDIISTYEIAKDHWHNYELFNIEEGKLKIKNLADFIKAVENLKVILLYLTPILNQSKITPEYKSVIESKYFSTECVAITATINDKYKLATSDFYIHGRAGIIDIKSDIKPCFWYGELHPFEFEFVINDNLGILKIFTNLVLISNKAEPESFHFEIEGDNYVFSKDKLNMYYRLEATKKTYLNLGSDVLFNRNYTKLRSQLNLNKVSNIFPLYYNKIDTFNDIYNKYQLMNLGSLIVDYENLSGSEIVWDKDLLLFNIITHIKNSPIDKVGRIRGNSFYKEGIWNVQIPSIIYNLKEEDTWNLVPPLVLSYIPDDIKETELTGDKLPNTYEDLSQVSIDGWTLRKETKIRDKWIKVRVRYSGKELAIIHSLITLYNISYS